MALGKIVHKNKIYVARTRKSDNKIHSFQEIIIKKKKKSIQIQEN